MKNKQNLHVHSTYCDGIDEIEDIILEAIERKFNSIGFSGHSYTYYALDYCMSVEGTKQYKKEIIRLAEKYSDIIKVYCGLEVDMYSETNLFGYDFLIGSVHYLKINDVFIDFDRDVQAVENIIKEHFEGNGLSYARAYYDTLSKLPEYGDFDIIGHFDLISKHSENKKFFNEQSFEYINAAIDAAEALAGKIPFFEVNMGAIARGYRKTPYPSARIIKELKRLGFGAIITSDCHDKSKLDCSFNQAREILQQCGFKERYILTDRGFRAVAV